MYRKNVSTFIPVEGMVNYINRGVTCTRSKGNNLSKYFLIFIFIAFWYLNAVYLRYEKQYRELYAWVIKERVKGNTKYLYDLDISRFDNVDSRKSLMFKNTLKIFYGTVTTLLIILLVVLSLKENWIYIVKFLKLIICNINI